METLIRDLRYSLRTLAQRPGFSAVVIVTLALGIGANTAIFSVVDAVLLRPLPFAKPDSLVRVWSAYPEDGIELGTTSPHDLDDWRAQSTSFAAVAGYPNIRLNGFVLTGGESPEEIETMFVTEGFFDVFEVDAELGRSLGDPDHEPGDNRVVVLSHGAWQRRFGADPGVVGAPVTLNGDPFTVIGIMPASFEYPSAAVEAWAPLSLIPDTGVPRRRPVRWLKVVARLADGVSIEQARAEMGTITGRLAAEYPDSNDRLTAATVRPLHEQLVGDVRAAMLTLFAAVGFVLLIGCANVANLVLARAEGRAREIAVRVALGAGKGRLLREVLIESLLLSIAGGLVGILVASWGVRVLVGLAPSEIPRLSAVGIDAGVLVFTFVLSVLTGLAFGAVPALRVAAFNLQDALKRGERGGSGGERLRSSLVVAEVALVVMLAIGAGLLIRTYNSLLHVDPGFEPEGVLTMRVAARGDDGYVDFLHEAVDRIAALPGVEAAGMVRPLPLRGDTFQGESFPFAIPGQETAGPDESPEANLRFVGPGYFEAMGIPLHSGRDFRAGDDREAPLVVILSRATVERYWDGESPVGTSILLDGETEVPIIGMVGDVRQMSLAEVPEPVVYVSHRQVSRSGMTFVVRTAPDSVEMIGAIQREIWELRPDQPINDIASMETVIGSSVAQPRFAMALLSLFAALSACLAAVGIYGVVAYSVGRRRREIGIRIALGAEPGAVLRFVVHASTRLAAFGIVVGGVGAFATTRLMTSLLFGVPAADPLTFVTVGLVSLGVAAGASLVPALRASRIDPIVALRHE